MTVLLILLCIICLCLSWLTIRLRADIRSLCGQLEELAQGSHMELAVNSRQKCLLALCRKMNQVLSGRDMDHIKYENAERLLKQNITNLAHDIRTPLTGAFGYVQLAGESNDAIKRAHYLQSAENRLTELEDMLEKLFLYTKLTVGDFTLSPENMKEIRVLPLLGDCLLSLYAQFEKAGTEPELRFDSEDFSVYAEEESLRRIFLNLIQNALLHGTGEIAIYTPPMLHQAEAAPRQSEPNEYFLQSHKSGPAERNSEKAVSLIFENPVPSGLNIDTSQIFDRFYKADTARGKGSSGLGLFIVKELMQKMGGDATARIHNGCLRIVLTFYK